MSEQSNLLFRIEAILFAYGDWLSIDEMTNILSEDKKEDIIASLRKLREKYREGYAFGIYQDENGHRWKMALHEEYEPVAQDVVTGIEIPKPVLKVLSVIAYEQPVTKTRLGEILGRSVKQELNYLYKARYVSYEKHGNGRYYKVTKKFYDYFSIDESDDFRSRANEKLSTFIKEDEDLQKDSS